MKKAAVGVVVVLALLGVCGGVASWRGLAPSLPGLPGPDRGRDEAGEPVGATITVYGALCPPGYAGGDYFGDCYGTPAGGAAYALTVGGTRVPAAGSVVAGDDGFAALAYPVGLGSGEVVLEATAPEEAVGGGWYEAPAAACTSAGGEAAAVTAAGAGEDGLRFAVAADGEDLRCDVYFVPMAADDGTSG